MSTAAIYARVSSARQKEDQTIASQTAALRAAAERSGLQVPPEWIFEDEGYSGATLIRLALERLRDLAAQVPIDVVLCYSPDRLARRYAYQALLIDEFARVGTEVRFVNGPKGETPEDKLLIQFQGMIAEYERNADVGISLDMPSPRICRGGPCAFGLGLLEVGGGREEVGISTSHPRRRAGRLVVGNVRA
jgi:DNA invertase Pin-like site-specific DNA recombinase